MCRFDLRMQNITDPKKIISVILNLYFKKATANYLEYRVQHSMSKNIMNLVALIDEKQLHKIKIFFRFSKNLKILASISDLSAILFPTYNA